MYFAAETLADGQPRTIFGEEPQSHELYAVDEIDRYSGTYILGTQGNGKSGLLINLILQDIHADRAVIVIDPHGDLVDDCLKRLPVWAVPKTYLLDMLDEDYPFGVNLFSHGRLISDADRTQVVQRIEHLFALLWEEVATQQNLPRYVRAATHVLLDNPGATLVDMYEFLLDKDIRGKMLKATTDPTVKAFWAQFNKLTSAKQLSTIQPLLNRLEALFMGRSLVRNIVGQKVTTINFRRAIEAGEKIFIKLPTKKIEADAELIGKTLFSQLTAAVFSSGDLPPEQRPDVCVYVDEAQHFANDDIETLFSEGRKFGIKLTLAHQRRDQLNQTLRDATMSARTHVVMHTVPDDGREMAHLFPDAGGEFEVDAHATSYLLDHPEQFPEAVQVFITAYLRPLANTHGKVTIRNPEDDIAQLLNHGKMPPPKENHPFPYLDGLFKAVMLSGNPETVIPYDAVAGFADCGRGFHQALRGWMTPRDFKPTDWQAPAHLADTAWKRRPENAKEQLLHYLFHLRATLTWLASHPVGTQKNASVTDVGRMLSTLPRRVAFIRSGNDGGVIRTLDTPEPTGNPIEQIRAQSRVKYAHPRTPVSPLDFSDDPLIRPDEPASRWENLEESA